MLGLFQSATRIPPGRVPMIDASMPCFFVFFVFFQISGIMLVAFWWFFHTFWGFGGQVGSGSEKAWKRSPNTQKKLTLFHKKTMFFLSRFFCDFIQYSGEAFLQLWWPKCLKWGTIGSTFPNILLESCKGETYGSVYTKHYFSRFLGVGFGNVGPLFLSGFPNWIQGCQFVIFSEI